MASADDRLKIAPLPETFPDLPALAARLGVAPYAGGKTGRTLLHMNDGTSYDLFELVNAFLDRLDRGYDDGER